jgi:hypothetical protein
MAADPMAMREDDLRLMLAAGCHIGTRNLDPNMEKYVWKTRQDGEFARAAMAQGPRGGEGGVALAPRRARTR